MTKKLTTLFFLFALATSNLDAKVLTPVNRGIGKYPGNPKEYFAPTMKTDNTYRNIALMRAAYASSSADHNLTPHLVTDGIQGWFPANTLTTKVNGEPLDLRNKLKTFDGNIHSYNTLLGEDATIEYEWTGTPMYVDKIKLRSEITYHADLAKGFSLLIYGSKNGEDYTVIGRLEGEDLPGIATERMASSDPNKWEAKEMLPMRELNTDINVTPSSYTRIKMELKMPSCAYWRLYCTELFSKGIEQKPMPSDHFDSAWQSDGAGEQWLYVDLGVKASVEEVRLYWLSKPKTICVQFSDDAKKWTNKVKLGVRSDELGVSSEELGVSCELIKCPGKTRYVRLLMSGGSANGYYTLGEMKVYGRNGLVAEPAKVEGFRNGRYYLNGGDWKLQRGNDEQWITATVPGTVLTSYMNIGAVPDNTYSDNMMLISESYFNSDFTYKTSFSVPESYQGKHVYLNLDGINWKADVMLNGKPLGRMEGAFIRGRYDITDIVKGTDNQLVVHVLCNEHMGAAKIKDEESTDLNGGILGADNPTFHGCIGWDWITSVPGREVGIWNDVFLSADNGVSVSDAVVTTHLNGHFASMTPSVFVKNNTRDSQRVTVRGWIGNDITFSKQISLHAGEERDVEFPYADYPQLSNQQMHLWWPNGYGEPYLYDAGFIVENGGVTSDTLRYKAGIREVSYSHLDSDAKIYVNGKRFDPLGGNWGFSETNLNYRGREYDIAVRYHRDMNFNMIRNWVCQVGDEEFYESCDRYGIMVWQDFWLANPWDGPDPYDESMFMANANDFISKIRNHPSIGIYVGRNEGYPPATLDKALQLSIKALHPQLGYISSSSTDGVSGGGPYRMLPIDEYFSRQSHKIHSERGMPNIPTYESLQRMLAPQDLWPYNIQWAKHDFTMQGAQRGSSFLEVYEKHFGKAQNAEEFTRKAQLLNYDGYRAMYEGNQQYRRGMLIWMSHSCWPSMVWDTYDYYFEPTGAFFGAKKACEPVHIQYNAQTHNVEVVNMLDSQGTLQATGQILDIHGTVLQKLSVTLDVTEDTTLQAFALPLPAEQLCYVRLTLTKDDKTVSENFYIENTDTDNFRALSTLQKPVVKNTMTYNRHDGIVEGMITLHNTSSEPALLLRLNIKDKDGSQILPINYSDNYLNLMPGEKKTVKFSYSTDDSASAPVVDITTL